MDRRIIYTGAIPTDTDQLQQSQNTMVALGYLAQSILGSGTFVDGLACIPFTPANLTVVVGAGSIYSLQDLEASAYGSLAADTTHQIVKQGIVKDSTTLSCPAPGTTGQSRVYLVQVAYQDSDTGAAVLPYYNASNPSVAYNGPANLGTSQNTTRNGVCLVQIKAGTAATTGTQVTPSPDPGFTGLYAVTVANGQTTITSGNIARLNTAPFFAKLTELATLSRLGVGAGLYDDGSGNLAARSTRTTLAAGRSYYVNAGTGSDANSGLSSGAAFATIQKAVDTVMNSLDLAGNAVTIFVADGTYAGFVVRGRFVGDAADAGDLPAVTISGNLTTPANCVINTPNSLTAANGLVSVVNGGCVQLQGLRLHASTSGVSGIQAFDNSRVFITGKMSYGNATGAYHNEISIGSTLNIRSDYAITGDAVAHYNATAMSLITLNAATVTITGTPTFTAFAIATSSTISAAGTTFPGSPNGVRYSVALNGVINTNGGGASFFPGTSGGTTGSGGQYA